MTFPSLIDVLGLDGNDDNSPFILLRSSPREGRKVKKSANTGWKTDTCMASSISLESTASGMSTPVPTANSPRVNPGAAHSGLSPADMAESNDKKTVPRSAGSGYSISEDLSRFVVGCSPHIFQDEEEIEPTFDGRWSPLPFPEEEHVVEATWRQSLQPRPSPCKLQVGDEREVDRSMMVKTSRGMPQFHLQRPEIKSFPVCAYKEVNGCSSGCTCEGPSCETNQEDKVDNSRSRSCPDIHSMEVSQKQSLSSPDVQTLHMQELEQASKKPPLQESNFGITNDRTTVNFVRASAKRSVSWESFSNIPTCHSWVHRRLPASSPPAEMLAAEEFLTACGSYADFSDEAFTAERLRACIDEARGCIQPWKPGRLIRTLHNNPYTRTTVDLMSDPGPEEHKVVVKRMPNDWIEANHEEFDKLHPNEREQPWHDLGILRHLNEIGYPFVCKLLSVFRDEENTYVSFSLASEGDLHTFARTLSRPSLTRENQLQPVARQVFSSVRWLHELGIAHRDLSLENVLVHRCYGDGSANCEICAGQEWCCGLCCRCGRGVHVKLCDFAMCSWERSCKDGVRGKRSYQAPEMHLEDRAYDPFLADAFALGVLLYASAAQDYPWNSTAPEANCDRFRYAQTGGFRKFLSLKRLRKTGPAMVQVFSEPLVTLLEGLMQMEPENRFNLGESCYMQPSKEEKQTQMMEDSVNVKKATQTLTTEATSVWATRWLNETHRASCFGC